MTINKYKSRTHETKLYSNILFWQSCIYMQWTHILLPSQHSWASSAADHRVHLHLSLLSIMSLTAAVRLNLIMDGKRTSRLSLPECRERMRKTMMTPLNHTILNKSMRDNLSPAVSAPNICVLLSMRTTTCKTITQSKTFYISCF